MPDTLNYRHLRYFQAIAKEGGLTRAAERMNVSQSALSAQLQKLEAQLGHPLFERTGKRLKLTEAGRIALDYADTIFETGGALVGTLQGRPQAARSALKIGALTTLSRNFQLEFVRPLMGRRDLELIVRSGSMRELLSDLEAHALDVVLANRAPERGIEMLRSHLLAEQPVSLVGRARSAPFRFPEDLSAVPILLPGIESELRLAFDRIVDRAGIVPTILAEVDDMAMLRLLARDSGEVTLVPPIVVRDELATGQLVELCRVPGLHERFYAIEQKRKFPNPLLVPLLERSMRGAVSCE